jgi:hypothetical protein
VHILVRMVCYLIIFLIVLYLGTLERVRKDLGTSKEPERSEEGVRVKLEAQPKSSSSLPRPAGPFDAKTGAQDVYGLRFRRTTYAWKANFIIFPMAPV